jgi:hypothetical protein
MRARSLIGLGLAAALAAGVGAYSLTASAQDGGAYGPGMMGGGYGPGMMGGYGPGYHMRGWGGGPGGGQWNCPGFAQDNESGPADMQGQGYGPGYGPGYHMRGWGGGYGPGMMGGYGRGNHMRGWGGGYGPGMMGGYCPGYDRRGDAQNNQSAQGNENAQGNQSAQGNQNSQTLNLSTDDVKARMERWLTWRGNPRLKVGEVKEKDADSITADVVTKDNSLVERFIFDRHTGAFRRDNS